MTNKEISNIFNESYNQFWMKWRDKVPPRDSKEWDALKNEADAIKAKYGMHLVRKWEGPAPTMEEEPVVSPLVNWFMDELEARERAIEDMRSGKKHFLFASYSLAKEGLDIPRLDRLYMTTPKKDYAVVTQSIGRIARVFHGKDDAVCFDYVDNIQFCQNQFKRRRAHYRKAGCIL